jgi:hypothetical protein
VKAGTHTKRIDVCEHQRIPRRAVVWLIYVPSTLHKQLIHSNCNQELMGGILRLPYVGRPNRSSNICFSDWCSPGGKMVPTLRSSIFKHLESPSAMQGKNMICVFWSGKRILKHAHDRPGVCEHKSCLQSDRDT